MAKLFHLIIAGSALGLSAQSAQAAPAELTMMPGQPAIMLAAYDLESLGYTVEEHFIAGEAISFKLPAPPSADGRWQAEADSKAPFRTRIVVLRPKDAARFNGTLLVEWLNVTSGQDAPPTWMAAHREILRRGYAYAAVSAQRVGVEGGQAVMGPARPLKAANPERYASLSHPGDAFSFDIYSQAGAALKAGRGLGGLIPKRTLALGESQSAAFLTTYVNAVDPLARVFDGFFIHSRFGSSASLDGTPMRGAAASYPKYVRFRPDLRVPVLSLITETDLLGAGLSGYHGSRRPDDARLRVWEIAGSAHADNYLFMGAFMDDGQRTAEQLAPAFRPSNQSMMGTTKQPFNTGQPHHYGAQAALNALERWVRSGRPPASTKPITLAAGGSDGVVPSLALDANGLARGGVRTPWVDVPTMVISGKGNPNDFISMLAGVATPFDPAKLAVLYPGGKVDYLRKFTLALDRAIARGHILRDDRAEIMAIAAINFDAGSSTPAAAPHSAP